MTRCRWPSHSRVSRVPGGNSVLGRLRSATSRPIRSADPDPIRSSRRRLSLSNWPSRSACSAPGSPWQNGFAERLIGSIRRECVDHIVVLGETHLRRVLKSYARYYNETRTHRSLDKDAPISRPVQRTGSIMSHALLGGLHHHYIRV